MDITFQSLRKRIEGYDMLNLTPFFSHIPSIHIPKHKEIRHFLYLTIIRYIILGGNLIFLPIYVYSNYGLTDTIFFFIMQYFFLYILFFSYLFEKLKKKYCIETLQIFSFFASILAFIILFLSHSFLTLCIASFLLCFNYTFYWLSKYSLIVFHSAKSNQMQESVLIDIIGRITYMLVPFISSFIIKFFGFNTFYAVLSFVVLFLLLIFYKHVRDKKTYIKRKINFSFSYLHIFFLEGSLACGWIILTSLLLFNSVNKSITFYGIIRCITQFLIITLSYYFAKKIDHDNKLGISLFSLILLGLLFYFSAYAPLNFTYYPLFAILCSLLINIGLVSPTAFLYKAAKKKDAGVLTGRLFFESFGFSLCLLLFMFLGKAFLYIISFTTLLYVCIIYYTIENENYI